MNNSDLDSLKAYIAEYNEKKKYTFSNDYAAIEVSELESAIRNIIARNPNNHDIVLAGVSVDGWLLEYASDELKQDPEIIYAAISNNPNAAQFVKNADILQQVKDSIVTENDNQATSGRSR